MVNAAKAAPGKLSLGTLSGSLAQIFLAFVQKENGFEINNIPYKGGGPMYQDALGGQIDMTLTSLVNMAPHVTAGKLKLLGVTANKRSKLAPNIPTLNEQGIKSPASYAWWGVYTTAGTPQPIIDRMHAEISKAVRSTDVTQKFVEQFDMEIVLSSPGDFATFTAKEREIWGKVIKDHGLKHES
jgi:tripartite-type tricarboxylate transporter receptor subunit TctC